MSEDTKSGASAGGVGFCGLLGLLFIGLKLGHVIDWPWIWVTAPVWGPLGLVLGILALALGVAGVIMGALWVGRRLSGAAKRYQARS